ncbi:MAG: DNA polymerase ligase N-terminal domain-containing protein [Candidatus Verstraetearchaeota archaeon]|nr:DNA polymerase ligase N-terminal domain-containing protein [Candidatus Verstraetearchaeota archaeon]
MVHEHHARRLHYDLRLERDGMLKSWAVPKGIPLEKGVKRLAIQVDDHPLDYLDFEGTIPEGEYGAGTVRIWDIGVYETVSWDEGKIELVFLGKVLNGRYALVRFSRAGESQWLLFRTG